MKRFKFFIFILCSIYLCEALESNNIISIKRQLKISNKRIVERLIINYISNDQDHFTIHIPCEESIKIKIEPKYKANKKQTGSKQKGKKDTFRKVLKNFFSKFK